MVYCTEKAEVLPTAKEPKQIFKQKYPKVKLAWD